MQTILALLAVFVGWIVLVRVVLPKFGFSP